MEKHTDCKDILYQLFKHLRDVQPLKVMRSPSPLPPCYIYGVGPVSGLQKYSDGTRVNPGTTWREFRVDMDEPVNQLVNVSQSTLGDFLDLMLPDALLSSFGINAPSDFSMERLQVVHDTYSLAVESTEIG